MENNTTQSSQPENINYTPTPQDPTPAQPLPRHMPKKLAIAGIVILLFLLLAGTAVGIYNLGKKSATPSPTPVAEVPPSPAPDSTADWKTYEGNGFSFQYPTSLKITQEKAYSFMTAQDVSTIKISDNDSNDPFSLKIFVENNPKNLSQQQLIDAYLKRIEGANDNFTSNRIVKTLTNYKNGEISGLYALFGADYDYDVIIMTKNNMIYTFVYTGDQSGKISPTNEALVKKILSTFKFTNPNSDKNRINFETFQKIKFYMDAPMGSTINGENVTVNGSTFNVISAGGRDGPCNFEEYGKTCTAEDIKVPNLPTGLKINTLRIWKRNGNVFMINPQTIYIKDKFTTDSLLITKTSPNTNFTAEETDEWINLLKTLNNE